MPNTFKKSERLKSKKLIKQVFASKQKVVEFPFLAGWVETELQTEYPVQVLIAVPKKKIKKAVDRNFIKRRIRESYRTNKTILYNPLENYGKQIALSIVYTTNEVLDFATIEGKIILTLQRIAKKLDENNGK